jgi:transmembrane sensor
MASLPSERLVEQALALIIEHDGAPASSRQAAEALRRWREKSPAHDAAAKEARRRWDTLGSIAGGLRSHFDDSAPIEPSAPDRRKMLWSIAALLGTCGVAGQGAWWYWQQPLFAKAYSTRVAQLMQLTLSDGRSPTEGSRIDMAPRSDIDVALYRQRRLVTMGEGEVRFEVARDEDRPFVVITREARIEVVGTAFTVRDRGTRVTVRVEHGIVRVRPLAGRSPALSAGQAPDIALHAGDVLDVRDGAVDLVRGKETESMSAWRTGWLVFDNIPLVDALATINTYRHQPILSRDGSVDQLRLSGRFRIQDSAGLLAALPAILPVTPQVLPDGSVELRAR